MTSYKTTTGLLKALASGRLTLADNQFICVESKGVKITSFVVDEEFVLTDEEMQDDNY